MKLQQLKNSVQQFWSDLLDSGMIKGAVDFGTWLIKFLDATIGKLGLFGSTAMALGGIAVFKKKGGGRGEIYKCVSKNINVVSQEVICLRVV